MKKIVIVGHLGNMGGRYSAILSHLDIEWTGIDVGDSIDYVDQFDGVIIATPTDNHINDISKYISHKVPILCEKPFTKDIGELEHILMLAFHQKIELSMVNQYAELCSNYDHGPSEYNYFNHGKDGLAWDCINILGMSNDTPRLQETSPVWTCQINGRKLNIKDMDTAYIQMIDKWVKNPVSNMDYILQAHERVHTFSEL